MPAVVHEFTRDQLAYALGESRAAADWLLTVAWHLATRLNATLEALADGEITRGKAELIVRLTHYLSDDEAKAVEAKILGRAGRLTPGGLRSALARAVLEVAPKTARERRQTAARFARVERWAEDSGNAALMGRELPPDEVLACDQRICWWAGELKKGGPGGRHGRAARPGVPGPGPREGLPPPPGRHGGPGRQRQRRRQRSGSGTAAQWRRRRSSRRVQGRPAGPAGTGAGGFAGRVTLTVPLGTAAGLADRPGELGGHGPVDPWLARDLVNAAAASPKTTWCVTVTDQHGHAVGHGCARPEPTGTRMRAGPGPPDGAGNRDGAGFSFTPASRDGPPGGYGTWRLTAPGGGPDLIVAIDSLGHRPVPAPVPGPGPRPRGQAPAPVPGPARDLHQPGVPAARRPVRLRAQRAV